MRKSDIRVGQTYTDGKGNVRKVLAEGPQFVLWPSQTDTDAVQYRVVAKKLGPWQVGHVRNVTRLGFATWAKEEVR